MQSEETCAKQLIAMIKARILENYGKRKRLVRDVLAEDEDLIERLVSLFPDKNLTVERNDGNLQLYLTIEEEEDLHAFNELDKAALSGNLELVGKRMYKIADKYDLTDFWSTYQFSKSAQLECMES